MWLVLCRVKTLYHSHVPVVGKTEKKFGERGPEDVRE